MGVEPKNQRGAVRKPGARRKSARERAPSFRKIDAAAETIETRSDSRAEASHSHFIERVKRLSARDRLPAMLGIECVDAGPGRAMVRVRVRDHHLNSHGMCHGGLIFTVADTAFGLASNSHGVVAVGVDAHIAYHVAAKLGDVLIGTAREVSRSRKLATYRIDVTTQESVLIASFTGTAYVTSRPTDPPEIGV
jgi:phenylacetic acid degradation protein PaaD